MTQMCWSSNTEVLYNTSVTGASTSLAVNELMPETSTLFPHFKDWSSNLTCIRSDVLEVVRCTFLRATRKASWFTAEFLVRVTDAPAIAVPIWHLWTQRPYCFMHNTCAVLPDFQTATLQSAQSVWWNCTEDSSTWSRTKNKKQNSVTKTLKTAFLGEFKKKVNLIHFVRQIWSKQADYKR